MLTAWVIYLCVGLSSIIQADPPGPGVNPSIMDAASIPASVSDDPDWNLRVIGLPCDPPFHSPGPAVPIVTIVDTGVDAAHPQLAGLLIPGYDFVDDDADPTDGQGHGTSMALVVVRVMPWVRIMPVRALGAGGAGAQTSIADGIRWATDRGADVINLSLGGPYPSSTMHDAVRHAWSHGAIVVAAGGNGGTSNPTYPAAYEEVIGVGATDQNDEPTAYSSYGPHISVVTPGQDVGEDWPRGGYQAWSGTGIAAAHVSGLVAWLKSHYPDLPRPKIREAIEKGADDLGAPGWDPVYGHGRIHVCQSLQWAARPWSALLPLVAVQ